MEYYGLSVSLRLSKGPSPGGGGGGGGLLPSNRLFEMCCRTGSHFHDHEWIDFNELTFSIESLERDRTFSGLSGVGGGRELLVGREDG